MKTLFIILSLFGSMSFAAVLKSDPAKGKVIFEATGKPSFLKIKGEGGGPEGEVKVDKTVTGTFKFKMDTLKTGIDLRDKHMKEKYLQVATHPNAELLVESVEKFDPAAAEQKSPFKGQITIHGVKKPVTGEVDIKKVDKGYDIKAVFEAKISDFSIDVPSYAGVTVSDTVKVNVESKLN